MKQKTENKVKVGDTLYSYVKGVIKKERIKKVGRVYFYIESNYSNNYPYNLETLQYNNKEGYSQWNRQLYRTEQEILDMREADTLIDTIGSYFNHNINNILLTLEELRSIRDTIFNRTREKQKG